jgi:hypothetical protein
MPRCHYPQWEEEIHKVRITGWFDPEKQTFIGGIANALGTNPPSARHSNHHPTRAIRSGEISATTAIAALAF